ncbi:MULTISPECIES: shikimate kinase [Cetobacterium]|jgi:shikimate kinase|uniref:Shikimate kinase n=1 Tax=Cetobacterium somerae ATCC BAA-474 TaxID=1319815 RepID=U7V7W0_9FUSO|nr:MULTISPECIES: shikimate kinase [Cetobacterium]ERT67616.1 shikimate kinase [Cetobacterium somerae ATCC BAA-474]MBC2853855.1 shikimate kinase [Cetobacterium sp. 2G large]MCQ9625582.1 shikimate kinase [Cetobacterium somerae]MCX3067890.1 shikimate kinase [Cetobacterium somerae]UPO97816.1 shikimate kinase [Cetobacterium somerae]
MKANIALIGFMGSGKTTIGRILARSLDMKFIDIDRCISMKEKRTIPEIFEEHGEKYFRDLERSIIEEESKDNNIVISTGGGAIIDNVNIKNLKSTSFVVYLDCDVNTIYERVKRSKTRPLLTNSEDMLQTIQDLYDKRQTLYKISSDFSIKIDSNTNIYDSVEKIKNAYILS